MSDIKLTDEQVKELESLWKRECKYIVKEKDGTFNGYEEKPNKTFWADGNETWNERWGKSFYVSEKYDFLSWEDKEPFYFGDLFEVVYKGV